MNICHPERSEKFPAADTPSLRPRGFFAALKMTGLVAVLSMTAGFVPTVAAADSAPHAAHTFVIGEQDFLLDGQRFQVRCGELHFARVPREYWRHRLQLLKAMGLNTVCAYLFWNFHEWKPGEYDWSGQADAAEFCRLAREEGLWVILRPGPYACAEWEMGGLPWWLLKENGIRLRSRDPKFIAASRAWLAEVGRVLGPLQLTHGGPILMVQVENEYGFYGNDAAYMEEMRRAVLDAGFDVPLFVCNPVSKIAAPSPGGLFKVVNFGKDPAAGFAALRATQPKGPLMCGEFYPGWFDTWGAPHHLGNTPQYLADLEYMLSQGASFSIYMAHGGTTFGLWSGTDRPFKPDTSSYDYDAPIGEAGNIGEKFQQTRAIMAKHLLPGETLPEPPAPLPATTIARFTLEETAPLFANLPTAIADETPRTMEAYDQGRGAILYRTTLPAGPVAMLEVGAAQDFGFVFLDGKSLGVLDRRQRTNRIAIPARAAEARLDILVEAMGRVNFGPEVHDRKGLRGPVTLTSKSEPAVELKSWKIFSFPFDETQLAALQWKKSGGQQGDPAFWRGSFSLEKSADTFLDVSNWGKGIVWVNGHCLGRFWNIGPTQTMFLPGPWLRVGRNEVVVFDLLGPTAPNLAGLEHPILDQLRPERDFTSKPPAKGKLLLEGVKPVQQGSFTSGGEAQEIRFAAPVTGRQFGFEALDAHDGKSLAAVAELDLLDADGHALSHAAWTIAYVSSEEKVFEDGSASNAIDGQTANAWITASSAGPASYPHRLILDLGAPSTIGGFRYTPRAGNESLGRIMNYRVYVGDALIQPAAASNAAP
jgi:beta-galactosidase